MSSDVPSPDPSAIRVRVRLGAIRLDYQGPRAFYERNVERLVATAAEHAGSTSIGTARTAFGRIFSDESASHGSSASPIAAAVGEATAGSGSGRAPLAPPRGSSIGPASLPVRKAYQPESPEFGRYVRRLGADVDAPDRHVMAFAFYLYIYERMESFNLDEIEGCLHLIGRTLPDDALAILTELVEVRRFVEPVGVRRWKLTKKGESYVKTRLLTL